MSHKVNGFIGPIDELQRLTTGLTKAKIVLLDVDGYGFLPYTNDLCNEIGEGWYGLGKKSQKRIVHVETDYFGGPGTQSAALWHGGCKTFKKKATGAINQALRLLGIQAKAGMDLFDTIGLGKYRTNEDWAEKAPDPDCEKDRQEALDILDQLAKQRHHDISSDP